MKFLLECMIEGANKRVGQSIPGSVQSSKFKVKSGKAETKKAGNELTRINTNFLPGS